MNEHPVAYFVAAHFCAACFARMRMIVEERQMKVCCPTSGCSQYRIALNLDVKIGLGMPLSENVKLPE